MATPVGITIPKLLPITGSWAVPLSLYYGFLCTRVSLARVNSDTYIGEKSKSVDGTSDQLQLANRCHGNFVEQVPLAMLLGAIVEMNGGNRKVLSGSFAALLLARILHAEFGIMGKDAMGFGRAPGHLGTLGFSLGMAGYSLYLVRLLGSAQSCDADLV